MFPTPLSHKHIFIIYPTLSQPNYFLFVKIPKLLVHFPNFQLMSCESLTFFPTSHILSLIRSIKEVLLMKVVIIPEPVLQPDITKEDMDIRWKVLQDLPEVDELVIHHFDGYPSNEMLHPVIGDADAVIGIWVNGNNINTDFLSQHPNLKYVATLGHGFGEFDVDMTRKKNMVITNTIYGAQTIAEYAWALLMEICHHVERHSENVKKIDWDHATLKDYETFGEVLTPQIELYGKTCGIFGLGAIGFAFAKMAQGFGMRVISYSRHKKTDPKYDFIEQVDFHTFLKESDVISIHAPLTPSTKNTFDAEAFAKMKDGVILINTARGGLIVEEALADALRSGKVYGAGLDVMRDEPPKKDNPLFHLNNTSITAHIAWLTRASRLRAIDIAIENFKAYLNGTPTSVIN